MSIPVDEWRLNDFLTDPFRVDEKGGRPNRSSKRKIDYYEGPQEEGEKVREVATKAIRRSKINIWTHEEVETVKRAVERSCSARGSSIESWIFDSKIMEQAEMRCLGRSAKQVREKWKNNLSPNSLGGSVQECHKAIIKKLSDEHPQKWEEISRIFSEMDAPGKPAGKYYSSNAIKNYIYSLNNKSARAKSKLAKASNLEVVQGNGDGGRSSAITTIASQSNEGPDFDQWCASRVVEDASCVEVIIDDLSEVESISSTELKNL